MSITKHELKHIADLARLKLSSDEENNFGKQLESILKYIEKLNEVDIKNIPITAQIGKVSNVFRSDNILDWDREEAKIALNQADIENGYVKVKRIL